MKTTIREVIIDDFDDIREILSEAFIETYPSFVHWQKVLKNKYIHTYVVEIDDIVVGCASLHILEKLVHDEYSVGLIEDVAVLQSFKGNGLGQKLVNQLIKVAENNKCYKVILNCERSLVDFYKKTGFYEKEIQMRLDILK